MGIRRRNWFKITTLHLPGDKPLPPHTSLTPYDPEMRKYDTPHRPSPYDPDYTLAAYQDAQADALMRELLDSLPDGTLELKGYWVDPPPWPVTVDPDD